MNRDNKNKIALIFSGIVITCLIYFSYFLIPILGEEK
jgi:hypothetical protein